MIHRIITGVILGGVALSLILVGPQWAIVSALVLVSGICAFELYGMSMPERRLEIWLGALLCVGLMSVVGLVTSGRALLPWVLPVSFAAAIVVPALLVLWRPDPLDRAAKRLLTLWGGLIYVGGCFAFTLVLASKPEHLLLGFLVVFAGDTGAYFVGRAVGRHKLYEKISPKKTIEGAVGGLALSVLGAWAAKWTFLPELTGLQCLLVGAVGGAFGQVGDLVESLLKRASGVKDSGRLLPGHGGFLDRLDGFLFAAPIFALMLSQF